MPESDLQKYDESSVLGGDIPAPDLPTVRTYKNDVGEAMRRERVSLVKMVLEEERAKEKLQKEMSPATKRNLSLIIISAVLLLAGMGLVYYVFVFRAGDAKSVLEDMGARPMVYAEKNHEIFLPALAENEGGISRTRAAREARENFTSTLSQETLPAGAIAHIFFTKSASSTGSTESKTVAGKIVVPSQELFSFLSLGMPAALVRTLGEEYMFGAVHTGSSGSSGGSESGAESNSPFILLTVNAYDAGFAGMLAWEKNIAENLLPLFGMPELVPGLIGRRFEDRVIKNQDVRVLKESEGKTILLFAFKNEKTVILAASEDALLEISRRLDISGQAGRK